MDETANPMALAGRQFTNFNDIQADAEKQKPAKIAKSQMVVQFINDQCQKIFGIVSHNEIESSDDKNFQVT